MMKKSTKEKNKKNNFTSFINVDSKGGVSTTIKSSLNDPTKEDIAEMKKQKGEIKELEGLLFQKFLDFKIEKNRNCNTLPRELKNVCGIVRGCLLDHKLVLMHQEMLDIGSKNTTKIAKILHKNLPDKTFLVAYKEPSISLFEFDNLVVVHRKRVEESGSPVELLRTEESKFFEICKKYPIFLDHLDQKKLKKSLTTKRSELESKWSIQVLGNIEEERKNPNINNNHIDKKKQEGSFSLSSISRSKSMSALDEYLG